MNRVIGLAVLMALGVGKPVAAQIPGVAPSERPTVVVIETALSDVTPSFEFVGRAEASAEVELRARVEGVLEQADFVEGGPVQADVALFVIERAPYEIGLQQRQAELAGAQAVETNARADFARQSELRGRGTISQASLDASQANLGSAQANVQLAEAAVARAELDLSYTEIASPIEGVISARNFDVGNLVSPSSGPLATVRDIDPIYVTIEISDRYMLEARREGIDLANPQVSPSLTLVDGQSYEHPGRFTYLAPAVDRSTDTVTSRAEFPNPDRLLVPGQLMTVVVRPREPITAIRVPQAAVLEDRDGYFVLVANAENIVEERRITIEPELETETDWVVSAGLQVGERLIVRGIQRARPGIEVTPVTEES